MLGGVQGTATKCRVGGSQTNGPAEPAGADRRRNRADQEFGENILQVEDVDEAFNAIYNLVNPKAGLTGKDITIAILDSGINTTPWINPNNVITRNTTVFNSTSVADDNGHGTMVGSIISRIAPDANIISLKVTDATGLAKPEWVQAALELALSLNVSIIHASLGSSNLNSLNSSG